MASDQFNIRVRGGGQTVRNEATLQQILDNEFGSTPGVILERATTGWTGIQFTHFTTIPITGLNSATGGALATPFTPKEGVPIVVTRAVLVVTTKSAGAATVQIGVATNGTTISSNLIDGADVGTAAGVSFDNITNPGTNGKAGQYMSGVQMVTVSGVNSTVGLVGNLYLEFIKAN